MGESHPIKVAVDALCLRMSLRGTYPAAATWRALSLSSGARRTRASSGGRASLALCRPRRTGAAPTALWAAAAAAAGQVEAGDLRGHTTDGQTDVTLCHR